MTIAVYNHKGGVGKTTTVINLADAIARRRRRPVLIVDLDAQASATVALGITPAEPSIADVLMHKMPAASVIRRAAGAPDGPTLDTTNSAPHGRVDLLPSSLDLAGADLALARTTDAHRTLATALAPIRQSYETIIIDCPPAFSTLTVAALVAADAVIVPTPADFLALEGLSNTLRGLREVSEQFGGTEELGQTGQLIGIVLTMIDRRARSTRTIADRLRQVYGTMTFRSEIPRSIRVAEAPLNGTPLSVYAPRSSAAGAYDALAVEVLARLRKL